jgi:hypothetical protein
MHASHILALLPMFTHRPLLPHPPPPSLPQVLSQLSKLCEGDVFEELELLAATDLSNVEYMPAYLNKRLNNKLWSRRKADGHVPG